MAQVNAHRLVRSLFWVALVGFAHESLAGERDGGISVVEVAMSRAPKGVVVTRFDKDVCGRMLTGHAKTHEDVAEFLRVVATVVSTPMGMGRVVERKREGPTVRVELFSQDGGALVDLPAADAAGVEVELVETNTKRSASTGQVVEFKIHVQSK